MDDDDREVNERRVIERRIAEAKESMAERLAELGDRLDRTRHALSVREKVERHPWLVLGGAALVGALLGRASASRASGSSAHAVTGASHHGLVGTIARDLFRSLLATLAAGVARDVLRPRGEAAGERDEYGVLRDPETRTTGVRIYPVD